MGSAISFKGALVFFLLSFGCRVGRLEVGGEVFFFKLYLVWRVEDIGHWTFYANFIGGGRFIFLSANRKAQGALLLFLLS
jgi:hypothetical protein